MVSRVEAIATIAVVVLILEFAIVHAIESSIDFTNSIRLNQVIMPPGTYTVKLQWGVYTEERSIQVNESPTVIELITPAVVNRSEIVIEIWRNDNKILHVLLAPTELGYDLIEYEALVNFVNSSQAIIVREVVFLANAIITIRPTLRSVEEIESMTINGRSLVPTLQDRKLVTPVFIVDKVVDLALKLKNGSTILARFSKIGEKGLSVMANFEGDLEEVKVHYSYGVNVVSWTISVPSALRTETVQLYNEEGMINAFKGRPFETKESSQKSSTTNPQGENLLDLIEKLLSKLKDLRFYLLLLSLTIGIALSLINRKLGALIILIGSLLILFISLV